MEVSKLKAIKLAYGEHWEAVKDYVDENGWLDKNIFFNTKLRYKDLSLKIAFEHSLSKCRPKSLQGIEDNLGWVKIESESDLPQSGKYWIIRNDRPNTIYQEQFDSNDTWIKALWLNLISHYQPIQKPKSPIY